MYKTASSNRQHAVDQRGHWQPWTTGDMPVTPADEAAALRAALKQLEASLLATTCKETRAELGQRKCRYQSRLAELRRAGALDKKVELTDYIIQVVKARMSKGEWLATLAAARRLYEEGRPAERAEGAA